MSNKLQAAKTAVILDQPFFGSLLCHLQCVEDKTCETAWTDGTTLGYNPDYVESLPHAELVGLLAHEVMHCAAGHPFRRDAREPKQWNIAADYAINDVLAEAGITVPKGGLVTPQEFKGKSAEYIYDRIPAPPQGSKCAAGEVRDEPQGGNSEEEEDGNGQSDKMSEGEWREITRQAATQAQMAGQLPSGLKRFAKDAAKSRVDWRDVLRKFVQQNMAKDDYTWSKPNSRYTSLDIFMPSMRSESMPPIAIAVDTSGSIDDIALAKAKAETISVMDECKPSRIDVLYADARVASHDTFEKGDDIEWRPKGGGGTDFRPVFEAIDAMEDSPCCVIYITDLQGTFPDVAPSIPVLWVTDGDLIAPFGDTIKMEA